MSGATISDKETVHKVFAEFFAKARKAGVYGAPPSGERHYVIPGVGNDRTGDGSEENPYNTIDRAYDELSDSDDRIYICTPNAVHIIGLPIDKKGLLMVDYGWHEQTRG